MHLEISKFSRIVILTGAGVSAESGIRTFRDSGGLWESYRIEDVATPEAFERDPRLVWRFYSMRRADAAAAQPNAAHLALARFHARAAAVGIQARLVTQNVDGLHERAARAVATPDADASVVAMHGTLSKSRCTACDKIFADCTYRFEEGGELPLSPCCGWLLRPHIVWFGEMPLEMDAIQQAVSSCDLFVTIGSSGLVYPAAGLLEQAKIAGAKTVCLNKEPIPQQGMVDFYLEGAATNTVPSLFHY